jgi:hypothetical protein
LLESVREAIRLKHYSPRTENAYLGWVRRFITFHDLRSPRELGADHIREFLSYLTTERIVSSSTQNQTMGAFAQAHEVR